MEIYDKNTGNSIIVNALVHWAVEDKNLEWNSETGRYETSDPEALNYWSRMEYLQNIITETLERLKCEANCEEYETLLGQIQEAAMGENDLEMILTGQTQVIEDFLEEHPEYM